MAMATICFGFGELGAGFNDAHEYHSFIERPRRADLQHRMAVIDVAGTRPCDGVLDGRHFRARHQCLSLCGHVSRGFGALRSGHRYERRLRLCRRLRPDPADALRVVHQLAESLCLLQSPALSGLFFGGGWAWPPARQLPATLLDLVIRPGAPSTAYGPLLGRLLP